MSELDFSNVILIASLYFFFSIKKQDKKEGKDLDILMKQLSEMKCNMYLTPKFFNIYLFKRLAESKWDIPFADLLTK